VTVDLEKLWNRVAAARERLAAANTDTSTTIGARSG
jgi:uncharacterized membrane protein